jgi:enamine deaminase RidA (YjgF/YER057c/UK114 family)
VLAGVVPAPPRDQYIPAVSAGARLFVAGHDPERGGRLAYRGRVGETVSVAAARAAFRLATRNALAAARAAIGSLDGVRCVVLAGFVTSATPDGPDPAILAGGLALLAAALPASDRPAVWLRPAQGLAGGMPVEVDLVLETRARRAPASAPLTRRPAPRRRRAGGEGAPAPRRSGVRTS